MFGSSVHMLSREKDTEHYLLQCPQFSILRQTLLGEILAGGFHIAKMTSNELRNLLLYGRPNASTL